MNLSKVRSHFDKRAPGYDDYSSWTGDPMLFRLCTEPLQDMMPDILCLDLGGGTGWIAKKDAAISGRRWVVLDISPEMAQHVEPPVKFIPGDAHHIPMSNESIGHIVIRSVLQYVNARKVLKECRRVMLPRGHLVVAQKVANFRKQDLNWHLEFYRLRSELEKSSWTSVQLGRLIRNCGFRILANHMYRENRKLPLAMWLDKAGTISKQRQQKILELLRNAPASVQKDLSLELTQDEISYARMWSIIISRPESLSPRLTPIALSMIVERQINGETHILLQKRKKRYEEPEWYGCWELPQGKLESNISAKEAVANELKQETELDLVTISDFRAQVDFDQKVFVESGSPLIFVRTRGSLDFLGIAVIVSARGDPRSIDIYREHTWFPVSSLPNIIISQRVFPLNKPMIEEYLARCRRTA